jgi:RNA polymerase sigma-70 factor (ECF subfamily)
MGAPRLTELLLGAASPPDIAPDDAPDDAIEKALVEIVSQARAAWPGVALSDEVFLGHLAGKLAADEPVLEALRKLHTADLYLACGCAHGDPDALARFDEHYLGTLDRALAKLGTAPDVIADVKQELRWLLLVGDRGAPKIATYSGRGQLRSWVRVVGVHNALARGRKAQREIPLEEDRLIEALPTGDPQLEQLKRFYRGAFTSAFNDALRRLPDRERTVLRQQLLDGLSIDQIGAVYRVHRATAARWLEQARQSVLATTRQLLVERLELAAPELDSILRMIESQLEISLGQLMVRRRS